VLPAQSFIDAPADAPDDLKTSGKYTTGRRVDAVGSDNNLPFSSSRDPNKADDNEFVLLDVGDLLKAK
jgi:hypothetical protein